MNIYKKVCGVNIFKMAMVLVVVFFVSGFFVSVPLAHAQIAPATWYVASTGNDSNMGTVDAPFLNIQYAIATSTNGDTINVAAGTYNTGQVVINKNLTIAGDSSDKPIIQPTGSFVGGNASDSWILIESGKIFNLSNVVINGGDFFINRAIRSHGNTTINNVDFRRIWGSTNGIGGPYQGIAIASFGGTVPGGAGLDSHGLGGTPGILTVTNSTFEQIGRIGILVKGTASTATLTGNTYTGKGNGDFLDYAFEFGAGGSGTVSGNTISGNRGVASDTSTSAGILVTDFYGTGTSATITGNTITNNTAGVAAGYLVSDVSVVAVHDNNLSGNDYGVNSTNPTVNALNNWWGDASGPLDNKPLTPGVPPYNNLFGLGNSVSSYVDYKPWFTDLGMTTVSSEKAITAFSLATPAATGSVNEANKTIAVTVPFGTNVTVLVASFTTTGASVAIGGTPQVTGTTANDFSSAVTYTVTAVDASIQPYIVTVTVAAPSAGRGGGRNRNLPVPPNRPISPPGLVNQGRVLGEVTFNFGGNLGLGSSGQDVTELQDRLRAEGYFTHPNNTGYFGQVTLVAVQAYQRARGIVPTSGYVGPLTRAELNKGGVVAGDSDVSLIEFVRFLIATGLIPLEKEALALSMLENL